MDNIQCYDCMMPHDSCGECEVMQAFLAELKKPAAERGKLEIDLKAFLDERLKSPVKNAKPLVFFSTPVSPENDRFNELFVRHSEKAVGVDWREPESVSEFRVFHAGPSDHPRPPGIDFNIVDEYEDNGKIEGWLHGKFIDPHELRNVDTCYYGRTFRCNAVLDDCTKCSRFKEGVIL